MDHISDPGNPVVMPRFPDVLMLHQELSVIKLGRDIQRLQLWHEIESTTCESGALKKILPSAYSYTLANSLLKRERHHISVLGSWNPFICRVAPGSIFSMHCEQKWPQAHSFCSQVERSLTSRQ